MSRAILPLLFLPVLVHAAAPPVPSPTRHGDQLRDAYFRRQAEQLGRDALAEVKTRADWERLAPQMRRQFLEMMGLWPLPARTDLKATIVGTIDRPLFTIEKLHYQSLPGLYVTAHLYVPKKRTGPCPAVLYVCGHGPMVIDGVAYGNKVTYQHHPAWFAENGYVCLIVDTLQLGELAGLHHGTARLDMWWWVSLGYTPAGVELWNALRGIDYLVSRKEVDPKRLGVTGRSGGGATSWWVGAADERVQCIIPVAGIADLLAHVSEGYPGRLADGVVAGHCDCMYLVNTYRWDYTQVMALCAPRALLLGNSDQDLIFPIPGYRRMADRIKRLYDLLGASDRFALLETRGPHKDTPELRAGAFRWMNRWLKADLTPPVDPDRQKIDPRALKVFDRPPQDAINDIIHERFRTPARLELPSTPGVARAWWEGKRCELLDGLRQRVFRGWPTSAPPLDAQSAGEVTLDGVRVRAVRFLSEEGVPLRLWLVQAADAPPPREILADVVDEAGWNTWLADLGPTLSDLLHEGGNPAPRPYPAWNTARFRQLRETLKRQGWAMAIVAPRGVGPTRWSERHRLDGKPEGHQIRRRFYLLGQTLEGQQIWDVRRAVQAMRSVTDLREVSLTLQGKGTMAVVALYALLFEPSVQGVEMWHPPATHRQGPPLMNVLTILDLPQAVGLALPRSVRLHVQPDAQAGWTWAMQLARLLDEKRLQLRLSAE
ncbi:MAG: prolyl oligopeptidase family serine peptidase [Gemmataceae bacterium]